jgi:hypothetical protein
MGGGIEGCWKMDTKIQFKGWGVAQVVEHLPSKIEALNSNSSFSKKKLEKII